MMPVRCLLGLHDWRGCTCQGCGKVRDSGHDLDGNCVCRVCRQERHTPEVATTANDHYWTSEDPWGVTDFHEQAKCSRCEKPLWETEYQRPF